jgi:flavin-dependent dehydrogenase
MDYDAIVVGAGPAGSTLARVLARSGVRVLLLDRASFPRDKPCGGGVSLRAASLLGLDLSSVTEQTIFDVRVSYRLGKVFRHRYPQPLVYMTQRCRLDAFLVEQAAAAGAEFHDGEPVRAVEVSERRVTVRTEKGAFTAASWPAPTASTASWDAAPVRRREPTWRWPWRGTCLCQTACRPAGRRHWP